MADFAKIPWDHAAYARPGWTADRAFAEFMARKVGVAVVPGSSFYMDESQGTTRVRFNFAKGIPTLQEAARRLQRLEGARH
jgi:aminotransferase